VKYVGGLIVSSISGWITGLVTSILPGILATILGGETFKEMSGLLAIFLGAIPFLFSMMMSLIMGLMLNRRHRATA